MRRMMPACAAPLEWDEDLRTFKKTPLHNWASHSADAFRYLSMAWREPTEVEEQPDPVAELLKKRTWQDVWEIARGLQRFQLEQLKVLNFISTSTSTCYVCVAEMS
jgi:hypothetical protein